jgi:hypothetical protein
MSVYDIDFAVLRRNTTPDRLRDISTESLRLIRRNWLGVLAAPTTTLYNQFLAYRAQKAYELAHNSQVCYMEAALNDTFDNALRRIYISDGVYIDPIYLYRRAELRPVFLSRRSEVGSTPYPSPRWLYRRSETEALTISFKVNVPASITFDSYRMKALINSLKLPGRSYSIVTF